MSRYGIRITPEQVRETILMDFGQCQRTDLSNKSGTQPNTQDHDPDRVLDADYRMRDDLQEKEVGSRGSLPIKAYETLFGSNSDLRRKWRQNVVVWRLHHHPQLTLETISFFRLEKEHAASKQPQQLLAFSCSVSLGIAGS